MGQPALAEHADRAHPGRAAGAVRHAGGYHRPPAPAGHHGGAGDDGAAHRGRSRGRGWLRIRHARRGPAAPAAAVPREERATWRMPPLALLRPVRWSPQTRLAMVVLRGYLVVSVLLLIVKAARLGGS